MNSKDVQATILVVEDDPRLSKALKDKLLRENYDVSVIGDGETAVDEALKNKPDLILLDIMLPGKSGVVVLEEIRKNPWGSQAKIIVLSNFTDTSHIKEVLNRNVGDYLVKSDWKLEDVVDLVKKSLA